MPPLQYCPLWICHQIANKNISQPVPLKKYSTCWHRCQHFTWPPALQPLPLKAKAEEREVDNRLEGSVRRSGSKIRITAQLIEAASDKHLWSATYDRDMLDIFAVHDEISTAIVTALKEKLGLNATIPSRDTREINMAAHNEYLKERYFIVRRTPDDIKTARSGRWAN